MPVATYNTKYAATFESEGGNRVNVWIQKKDYVGSIENFTIDGEGVIVKWLSNNEDKFTPIRASECIINIWLEDSSPAIDIDTFIGADDEWKVVIWSALNNSKTYWQGFIVQEETSRPLQNKPYTFQVRATDGLGRLKDRELRRYDGTTKYKGKFYTLDIFGEILWKLNPGLDVVTHFNVFESTMTHRGTDPLSDPLFQSKIDGRTFIRTSGSDDGNWDDEYTVLEKLLKAWGAVLFQYHGAWHIVDLESYLRAESNYTIYSFDTSDPNIYVLDPVDSVLGKQFVALIAPANSAGYNGTIFPTLEDQLQGLKFANKYSKLTYYYSSDNLPANYTWRSGTFIGNIGSDEAYTIDDWQMAELLSSATVDPTLGATAADAYRLSIFDAFGYETDHYLVMESLAGDELWFKSEGIPVVKNDKITISFDVKGNGAGTLATYNAAAVYLLTEAGGRVSLKNDGTWPNVFGLQALTADFSDTKTEWKTVSVESAAIPYNGTIYIVFRAIDQLMGTEVYFRDLKFSYLPYIGGSNRETKGDYNKITGATDYKQKSEEEVHISDGVRKTFKGALFKSNGTDLLTPRWNYGPFTGTNQRFGEMQAVKRWRHYHKNRMKIEGSFEGVFFYDNSDGTIQHIGLLNLFQIEARADGIHYMLTDFEVNLATEIWNGVLIETGDADTDVNAIPTTREYKYFFE